jgi:hypothetical protein
MAKAEARAPVSTGLCEYCKETIAKSGMTRHLKACKARKATYERELDSGGKRLETLFHLSVTCDYAAEMWLHLEIPASATLLDLDHYLREIWLECCNHLSMFKIKGKRYEVDRMYGYKMDLDFDDEDDATKTPSSNDPFFNFFGMRLQTFRMSRKKLSDALEQGQVFDYEYDFGSTTALKLKVQNTRQGLPEKSKYHVRLLARNLMPEVKCQECDKNPATIIDLEAIYDGKGLICKACARKRKLEDMILPLVNSPRAGECGYTGDAPDDWADFL